MDAAKKPAAPDPLFPDELAVIGIDAEHPSRFLSRNQDLLAALRRCEDRRRGEIEIGAGLLRAVGVVGSAARHVPGIALKTLEMPLLPAGLQVDGDDRIARRRGRI